MISNLEVTLKALLTKLRKNIQMSEKRLTNGRIGIIIAV